MIIGKILNIRLTEKEMKSALLDYFRKYLPVDYYNHLRYNNFMIDCDNNSYVICVDGEVVGEVIDTEREDVENEGCNCHGKCR